MHNKFELTGVLIKMFDTNEISAKFKKREFVIEVPHSTYPQTVLFQLTQDNCELIDEIEVGDTLTIDFNIKGRAWDAPDGTTKYFNSLEAWRVVKTDAGHEYSHSDTSGDGEDLSF